jgi:hypothetical protein
MGVTPWANILARRKANIGFITRLQAFDEPTPEMKASALALEINKWQETIGKRPYSVSAEYKTPLGPGINLKRTREPGGRLDGPEYQSALHMYVVTPMDHFDILKSQGIDVSRYEKHPNIFQRAFDKIYDWFKLRKDPDYIRLPRLSKEFIETFKIKEKK